VHSLGGGETIVGTDSLPACYVHPRRRAGLKLIESSWSLDMAVMRGTRRVGKPIGRWGGGESACIVMAMCWFASIAISVEARRGRFKGDMTLG